MFLLLERLSAIFRKVHLWTIITGSQDEGGRGNPSKMPCLPLQAHTRLEPVRPTAVLPGASPAPSELPKWF